MEKRILSLVLALCLLLALVPQTSLTALASKSDTDVAYAVECGYIYFNKETGEITDCDETVTSANIPAEIDGVAVTGIGYEAFQFCDNLTSVTIPDSVTSINSYAFKYCYSLTSVTIPDGITRIGYSAFAACYSLTSVTIPASVTSLEYGAFAACTRLTGIWVSAENPNYSSDERGVLYNKDKTKLIRAPGALEGDYTIPDSVTSIENKAFEDCTSLTSVIIPNGVPRIGYGVFCNCASLTSVIIKSDAVSIGEEAFYDCSELESICFEGSPPDRIENYAFPWRIVLYYIEGKEGWTTPYWNGYRTDTWDGVNLPERFVTYAVEGGNLYFDAVYCSIYNSDKSVTSADIPSSINGKPVTEIGENAFEDCTSLTSVTIPDGVTSIERYAFQNCTSLTSVTIPDSVTSIGDDVFWNCTSLTSVTIPDSVTSIERNTFWNCTSLTGIWVSEEHPNYSNDERGVLFNKDKTELILAPGALEGEYTIPDSVTSIRNVAFRRCTSLISVTIPDSVTSIGDYAFLDCTSLTSVTIPNSVTRIESYVFSGCTSLTSVIIPDSVTSIEYSAFRECTSLISVTIPNSVTSIEDSVFQNCTSLASVIIPDGVTEIAGAAFADCYSLTNVIIPDGVTEIGGAAFAACYSLTSVTIPDGVTSIERYAFQNCTSLLSATIPASVTYIGDRAFSCCKSMTGIWVSEENPKYSSDERGVLFNKDKTKLIQAPGALEGDYAIPASVTYIGDGAFSYCNSMTGIWVSAENPNYSSDERGVLFNKDKTKLIQAPGALEGDYSIPNSVSTIEYEAFEDCTSLISVTIPDSVTKIGSSAFMGCTSLTGIWVSTENPYYSSDERGVLFNKVKTELIMAPDALEGDYSIPNSVSTIEFEAFEDCTSLTSVIIPDSVTEIRWKAFYNCVNLKQVYFLGDAPKIGSDAFYQYDETSKSSIVIPGLTLYYMEGKEGWTTPTWNGYPTATWDPNHVHSYTAVVTDPTCTEQGYTTYTCDCGDSYVDTYVDALGHDHQPSVTKEPSCTEEGVRTYTCSRCGDSYTETIAKLNHSYITEVIYPTCTERGYTTHSCDCGDSYVDTYVDALGHDFVINTCSRCGAKGQGKDFSDVSDESWFYDYVVAATNLGLVNGYEDATFRPSGQLTRAEATMLLYRAAGEPAVTGKATFTDLDGEWYQDAICWAQQNHIVNGISATEFAPNAPISREAFLTMIWRAAGSPAADGSLSDFADTAELDTWAVTAFAWAVEKGIINGTTLPGKTGLHLAPLNNITRAEAAKILVVYTSL